VQESLIERWLSKRRGQLTAGSVIDHQPTFLWLNSNTPPTMNVTVIDGDPTIPVDRLKVLEEWEVLNEQNEDQEQRSLFMLSVLLGKSFLAFRENPVAPKEFVFAVVKAWEDFSTLIARVAARQEILVDFEVVRPKS